MDTGRDFKQQTGRERTWFERRSVRSETRGFNAPLQRL